MDLSILPDVITGIALLGGAFFTARFLWRFSKLDRILTRLLKELQGLTAGHHPALVEDVDKILERLANRELLLSWREYKKSLMWLGARQKWITADGADHHFSVSRFNDLHLGTHYLKHIPGMLTGLGIVGTFCGIWLGLDGLTKELNGLANQETSKAIEQVNRATTKLFEHVGPAFRASLVCVFVAVVMTMIEKYLAHSASSKLQAVWDLLDGLFEKAPVEQTLFNIQIEAESSRKRSEQHSILLKELLTDFLPKRLEGFMQQMAEQQHALNERMGSLFEDAIRNQTNSLVSAQQSFPQTIADALSEHLTPMSANLTTALEQIKKESSSSTTQMLEDLSANFQNALAGSAGTQLDSLAKTLEGSTSLLSGQRDAMEGFVSVVQEQMKEQSMMVSQAIQQNKEQADEQRLLLSNQIRETVESLSGMVQGIQIETAERSKGTLDHIGNTVAELLERSINIQETSTARIQDSIEASQNSLLTNIQEFRASSDDHLMALSDTVQDLSDRVSGSTAKAISEMQQGTTATLNNLSQQLQSATTNSVHSLIERTTGALTAIERQTTALLQSSSESQKVLSRELQSVIQLLGKASNETTASGAALSTSLRENLAGLDKFSQSMQPILGTLGGHLQQLQLVGDRLKEASGNARLYSEKSAEQSKAIADVVSSLERVHSQIKTQSDQSDVRLESLQQATLALKTTGDNFTAVNTQLSSSLKGLSDSTGRYFDLVSDKQEKQTKALHETLKQYLHTFEGHFSGACSSLSASIEPLSDMVEELTEIYQQQNMVRP